MDHEEQQRSREELLRKIQEARLEKAGELGLLADSRKFEGSTGIWSVSYDEEGQAHIAIDHAGDGLQGEAGQAAGKTAEADAPETEAPDTAETDEDAAEQEPSGAAEPQEPKEPQEEACGQEDAPDEPNAYDSPGFTALFKLEDLPEKTEKPEELRILERAEFEAAHEHAGADAGPAGAEPAAYGADPDSVVPEQPVPAGTEIDEEWFSGDKTPLVTSAQHVKSKVAGLWKSWKPAMRAGVVAVCCIALVLLVTLPYGGVANVVDFFVHGANPAPASSSAQEDPGSSTAFVVQESFNYSKKAKGIELTGDAAKEQYYLANRGELTSVKLQSPWQSCWAFAATGALESSVLKAAHKGSSVDVEPAYSKGPKLTGLKSNPDYSERHLAWFAHEVRTKQSASSQAGEGISRVAQGYVPQLAGGGLSLADAQFSTSKGIVLEADEPYQYNGYSENDIPWYQLGRSKGDVPAENDSEDARNRDWSLTDAHAKDSNGVLVKGVHVLPSPSTTAAEGDEVTYVGYDHRATNAIKQALVDYGAVAFSYHADVSKPGVELLRYGDGDYFSYDNWAQYDDSLNPTVTHAACIVGWDDAYPAKNFTGSKAGAPKGDGAWLVKNSWGSTEFFEQLGMNGADARRAAHGLDSTGFFWLSYYDHTICSPYAFEVATENEAKQVRNTYQYDYLATADVAVPAEMSPAPKVANVFEAKANEEVYAVSARTYKPKSKVRIEVVKLGESGTDPSDGTVAATMEVTSRYGGFEVFELDQAVEVGKGERFAVVQQVYDPAQDDWGYLNLETAAQSDSGASVATVVANEGETFVKLAGADAWKEPRQVADMVQSEGSGTVTLGNAMIKAYTRTVY